jgi:tetratricopeptide (TPR) repeat protein
MNVERSALAENVFPQIRQYCLKHGVEFYAVDLRWGITSKEAHCGETVNRCLGEVKKCIPFFIGLVGHRYGWQPQIKELASIDSHINQWMKQRKSVTEMEISAGPFSPKWLPEGNSAFFLRTERGTKNRAKREGRPLHDFMDAEGSPEALKINRLRNLIEKKFRKYSSDYSSEKDLCIKVRRVLKKAIKAQIDKLKILAPDALRDQEQIHFASQWDFLSNQEEMFWSAVWQKINLPGCWEIQGASGSGKSICLAVGYRLLKNCTAPVFIHFAEASGESGTVSGMMRRLLCFWAARGVGTKEIPHRDYELVDQLYEVLSLLKGIKWYWIIDGFEWVPHLVPEGCTFVRTSTSLKKRVEFPFRCITLSDPPKAVLQAMTQRRLQSLGKNLLPAHLRAIRHSKVARSPLGAILAVDFLRLHVLTYSPREQVRELKFMKSSEDLLQAQLEWVRLRIKSQKLNRLLRTLQILPSGMPERDLISFSKGRPLDWSLLCDALGGAIQEINGKWRITSKPLLHLLSKNAKFAVTTQDRESFLRYFRAAQYSAERQCDILPDLFVSMNDFQGMAKFLTEPSVFLYLFHPEHRHLLVQWVLLPGVVPFFVSKLLQKARKSENAGNVGFVRNAGEFLLELQFVKEGHQILAPFASLHPEPLFQLRFADALQSLGKPEAAIAIYQKLSGKFQGALNLYELHNNQGLAFARNRQPTEARKAFEKALVIAESHKLSPHLKLAVLKNLAELANEADNLQERDLWLHRSESLVKRHFPPEHPFCFEQRFSLLSHRASGSVSRCRQLQKMLHRAEKSYGSPHPQVAMAMHNLGVTELETARKEKSEDLFSSAMSHLYDSLEMQKKLWPGPMQMTNSKMETYLSMVLCEMEMEPRLSLHAKKNLERLMDNCEQIWPEGFPERIRRILDTANIIFRLKHRIYSNPKESRT